MFYILTGKSVTTVATIQLWLSSEASLDLFFSLQMVFEQHKSIFIIPSRILIWGGSFPGVTPRPSVPPLRDGSTCKILTNSWSNNSFPLTKATAFTINSVYLILKCSLIQKGGFYAWHFETTPFIFPRSNFPPNERAANVSFASGLSQEKGNLSIW